MNRDIQAAILRACARHMSKLLEPIEKKLIQLEQRAMTPGPRGADGKDGAPGRDGKDASQPTHEELRAALAPVVEQRAAEWLEANRPANGKDGAAGRDGTDGVDGRDGESITLDQVRPMIESEMAKWALDFERRAHGVLERAVERIPAPQAGKDGRDGTNGKDGLDALQLEDFNLTLSDDGRTVTLSLQQGDRRIERSLQFPVVIDRGVYSESGVAGGGLYEKGDGVSFGGSFWIAQKDAPNGKPGMSGDWRLAVKKGRDGKDGRNGIDLVKPVKGDA